MFELLVLVLFPGLVLLAGTSDLFTMTIPNKLCVALVATFFVTALIAGMPLSSLGWHVASALIALLFTFGLFAAGVFGGGDAKLTAAVVLWLGPTLAWDFALLAAIYGGVLTLGILLLRRAPAMPGLSNADWMARLLSPNVGVPYGIALSMAVMTVLPKMPWFQSAIGF